MNFRLTKYDPKNRNAAGHYMVNEWISVSDIGRACNGVVLTAEEYMRIESAHVRAFLSFCHACGLQEMVVDGLENYDPEEEDYDRDIPGVPPMDRDLGLREGLALPLPALQPVIRSVLREKFWCRLIGAEGSYIHFSWDYYTYVGSPRLHDASFMREPSLFIEPWESPCHRRDDDDDVDDDLADERDIDELPRRLMLRSTHVGTIFAENEKEILHLIASAWDEPVHIEILFDGFNSTMSLMLRDDAAHLRFFSPEDEAEDSHALPDSSPTSGEPVPFIDDARREVLIPAEAVIPRTAAIQAVLEFSRTGKRPTCLRFFRDESFDDVDEDGKDHSHHE